MTQLGAPRGSFDSRALIDGSEEMKKFIAEQDAAVAERARVEEEDRQKSENARLALVEQKRSEKEVARKRLLDATATGKTYEGFIQGTGNSTHIRQAIKLQFTSQSGALVSADIHNPDQPAHRQTLNGELVFEPDSNQSNGDNRQYPILLSPKSTSEYTNDKLDIYFEQYTMKLEIMAQGVEGVAATRNHRYALRLQSAQ